MTVDVEDYYHVSVFDGLIPRHEWDSMESRVVANTERLLEIFSDADLRATFFVLGLVAERHPALVARIASSGHEVASHGFAHRLIYDQTPAGFRQDVRRAKGTIEQAAGAQVLGYRAPSYSVTPRSLWAIDVLIDEGYQYDASIFPIRHDRYGIPVSGRFPYIIERAAGTLLEAPASTVQLGPFNLPVAGGGYFRILPYAWTHWGIARVNRVERQPVVFYLHPWEIDPGQPRLRAGLLGRLRHYRNLESTESRLERLIQDFAFGSLKDVLQLSTSAEMGHPIAGVSSSPLPYVW